MEGDEKVEDQEEEEEDEAEEISLPETPPTTPLPPSVGSVCALFLDPCPTLLSAEPEAVGVVALALAV